MLSSHRTVGHNLFDYKVFGANDMQRTPKAATAAMGSIITDPSQTVRVVGGGGTGD